MPDKYYEKNREKVIAKANLWISNNRKKFNERCRVAYHKNKDKEHVRRRKYYLNNKEAQLKYARELQKRNPEAGVKASRRRMGIKDPSGEIRTGNCEICNAYCKLQYDHDHQTGLFRGWLCFKCNVLVGWYEKTTLDKRIKKYLKKDDS